MARKTLNRKELRRANEAAEKQEKEEKAEKKTTKKKAPKKKRASRRKSAKDVRKKAYWGVFNQALKQVALFEYAEKDAAEEKAADLTESQDSPHFVQMVKREIEE